MTTELSFEIHNLEDLDTKSAEELTEAAEQFREAQRAFAALQGIAQNLRCAATAPGEPSARSFRLWADEYYQQLPEWARWRESDKKSEKGKGTDGDTSATE